MKKGKQKSTEYLSMEIEGKTVPVKVHREQRRSLRASVGKDSFIFRMPLWLTEKQETEGFTWFKNWAIKTMQKNDSVIAQFTGRTYENGSVLEVGERHYQLDIVYAQRKTHSAQLQLGVIYLTLNKDDSGPNLNKNIRTLLSRVVGQDFLPEITRRVHELNALFFKRAIKGVRLKYNHSNWGSCSNSGNINLSTRLLFAPAEVIDYVIIHELAHLIEMNHSPRFWQLVENAMPNYKDMEQWLKENRSVCDF